MKWAGLQGSNRDEEKNSNLSWEPDTGISDGLDMACETMRNPDFLFWGRGGGRGPKGRDPGVCAGVGFN